MMNHIRMAVMICVMLLMVTESCLADTSIHALFDKGQYSAALEQLNRTSESDRDRWQWHYNMGTIYLQLNQLGYAIGHLQQAYQLQPRHSDISHNLSIAASHQKDGELQYDRKRNAGVYLLSRLSHYEWVLLIGGLVTVVHAMIWLRFRRLRYGFTIGLCLGIVAYAIYLLGVYHQPAVVVTQPKVGVKSGPSDILEPLFFIHDGLVAIQMDQLDGWRKLKFSNGIIGWVPSDTVWRY